MRKFAITLAAAGAALGFAAPASAQFYPRPVYGYAQPTYGYAQPAYGYAQPAYGYAQRGYGYNNGAVVRNLDMRIAGIRGQIRAMQSRGMIRSNKARSLDRQAMSLQRSVHARAWNGIGGYEARSFEMRIARLEQQVRTASLRQRYAPRYGARYAPRYAGYRW